MAEVLGEERGVRIAVEGCVSLLDPSRLSYHGGPTVVHAIRCAFILECLSFPNPLCLKP